MREVIDLFKINLLFSCFFVLPFNFPFHVDVLPVLGYSSDAAISLDNFRSEKQYLKSQ